MAFYPNDANDVGVLQPSDTPSSSLLSRVNRLRRDNATLSTRSATLDRLFRRASRFGSTSGETGTCPRGLSKRSCGCGCHDVFSGGGGCKKHDVPGSLCGGGHRSGTDCCTDPEVVALAKVTLCCRTGIVTIRCGGDVGPTAFTRTPASCDVGNCALGWACATFAFRFRFGVDAPHRTKTAGTCWNDVCLKDCPVEENDRTMV